MNLGRAIQICRKHLCLTQAELAEKADISISYLSLIEKNKRDANLRTIENIAHAMRIPTSLLMFLAADNNELSGIDKELVDKIKYTTIKLIDAASEEPSLL